MPVLTINEIAVLIVVAIGAICDVRTMKIPNKLTFPSALVGIILQTITAGLMGFALAIAGWFSGALIMILPHPKRKIGFGDAKLMAAVGAFLGPASVLMTFFYFALLYGAMSILKLALVLKGVPGAQTDTQEKVKGTLKAPIPIGPAIAGGTLLAVLLKTQTLKFFGFH